MNIKDTKIVFLNQVAGTLFRELAEDVANDLGPALLYAGRSNSLPVSTTNKLVVETGPPYDRRSLLKRFLSWMNFFFKSLRVAGSQPAGSLLFIVTNPPFLGLIGLFLKLIRNQKYVVLVYDVYPDVLVALGTLQNKMVSNMWFFLNRLVFERADLIFAISRDMAALLDRNYDLRGSAAGQSVVVHNWADINSIKPLDKQDNWFAVEHHQADKITILYSGNMGNSHDIESIIAVAWKLRGHPRIQFLFIGDGAKRILIERAIREEGLTNITLLPFQSEEVLPYSMAAGDIGIVAYQPGTEGCIVPSKTYYYMAAGLVPLILCGRETDLTHMAVEHCCGIVIRNGDIEGMAKAILRLEKDNSLLSDYKQRARKTAERLFSRNNTACFVRAIEKYINDKQLTQSKN